MDGAVPASNWESSMRKTTIDSVVRLAWVRDDRQGETPMGEYTSRAEATAAIPAARAELLGQGHDLDGGEFLMSGAGSAEEALEEAPWAADVIEVEGGWMAFESTADADTWRAQA